MVVKKAEKPRKGGRPSQARAGQIRDEILDIATDLFLTQGYGATSIEAIAQQGGISKRTFYHRFANKGELFSAVVHRMMTQLRPKQVNVLFTGDSLEEILPRLAKALLRGSLAPQALALHRLMLTEAVRFPELTQILDQEGARQEAIQRIADLLSSHLPASQTLPAMLLAEQFMQLVVSVPQRRALGLGVALTSDELADWADQAVQLFLHGIKAKK